MHIALVTCAALPEGIDDEAGLRAALRDRGARVSTPAWSDADTDWTVFDACVIRSTWDYQEHLPEFLAWARRVEASALLLNDCAVLRWNAHKSYLRTLADRGVPTLPTAWLDAGGTASIGTLMRQHGWHRAVVKPAIGATARETIRFDLGELDRAQAHVDRLLPHEDLLLQPYLRRVEQEGEISGIFIDGVLTHAVRKVPAAGDYRVQDDFGAHDEPYALRDHERAVMEAALAAAPFDTLYGRADLMWDDEGRACLGELELVEPLLFFRHAPKSVALLADAIAGRLRQRLDGRGTRPRTTPG